MRQDTAPQLATRLAMGHRPTGGVYLSTEPVSRRLAASAGKPDWQHQQVNQTGTSAFPRCAGQLVAKAKRRAAAEVRRDGETEGGARPMGRTRMLTPLIDGLGRATSSSTMPVTRSRTPSF